MCAESEEGPMSYPPPSGAGQSYDEPPYGPNGSAGSPGQFQPSQPNQSIPAAPENRRGRRWRRITLGAVVAVAAVLSLFLTVNRQNQPPTTTSNSYPVHVRSTFLTSCETNGSQAICDCTLSWFEQHVSYQQFEQDQTDVNQGSQPVDIGSAERACR
jgi:hypothetical protein